MNKKKLLALLMALVMTFSLVPVTALAEVVDSTSNNAVAEVGETYYSDLQEAIAVAMKSTEESNKTVTLLKDVSVDTWYQNVFATSHTLDGTETNYVFRDGFNLDSTLNWPGSVTIDGNGCKLTVTQILSGTNGDELFCNAENLIVRDLTITAPNGIGIKSGIIENVKFNMTGGKAIYTGANDDSSHIEIKGCTFDSTVADTYGIYSHERFDLGTETGTIISGNTFNTYRSVALRSDMQFLHNVVNSAKGVTVATNSTARVEGNYFTTGNTSRSINIYPAPDAVITGNVILGDIELETDKEYSSPQDLSGNYWGGGAPETVPGKTFSNSYYDTADIYAERHADGTLFALSNSNASVAQIGDVKYATLEAAFAAAQSGATITLLADCAGNGIKAPQGKFATGLTVDFNGKTYTVDGETVGSTGTETNGFQLLKDNTITFKNGTIASEKAKILVQNYSDLTLDGMTLTLDNPNYTGAYTLSNNNGDIVIKDTTINANPYGGFAFDVCRYSSYPSVRVTVEGDSYIEGDVEIFASKSDAKDGFSLTLSSGTMTGNIVMDASAATAMAANSDKVSITKAATFDAAAPTGYRWDSDTTLAKIDGVAAIGDTGYTSLEAAFSAAFELAKDENEVNIELLADCSGNGIVVPAGKFSGEKMLTVDFHGYTYTVDGTTVGSTGTETNGFQLLKDNNIYFVDGTITSEKAKILVQNYSNLTLQGMTLTLDNPNYTSAYTLSNNNGDVHILGTTINANPAGGFAFDVCRFSSYPSVNVTVGDLYGDWHSVINGDIEISASGGLAKEGFSLALDDAELDGEIVLDNSVKGLIDNPEYPTVSVSSRFLNCIAAPAGFVWNDEDYLVKAVAEVNGTGYATLEEAIWAADDDDTVVLLRDIALDGTTTIDKSITIDGNNKTVTAPHGSAADKIYYALYVNDEDETVQKKLNVVIKDLNMTTDGYQVAVMLNGSYDSTLALNNVDITSDGACVYANGLVSASVQDCEFTRREKYIDGKDSVYYSALVVGYGGEIIASDCKITGDGTGVGTFPSGGTVTLYNTDITIGLLDDVKFSGLAIWSRNEDYTNYPEYCRDSVITFHSGKVSGDFKITDNYTAGDAKNVYNPKIVIDGGYFTVDPSAYVADGYQVITNTDPATSADYPHTVVEKYTQQSTTDTAVTSEDGDTTTSTAFAVDNTDGTYVIKTQVTTVAGNTSTTNTTYKDVVVVTDTKATVATNWDTTTASQLAINDARNAIDNYSTGSATFTAKIDQTDASADNVLKTAAAANAIAKAAAQKTVNVSAIKEAKVTLQTTLKAVGTKDNKATVTYDITPVARLYGENNVALGEPVALNNEDIEEGQTFTFTIPVPANMRDNIKVRHIGSNGYATEIGTYTPEVDTNGVRYITVTVDHFSEFELEEQAIDITGSCKISASLSLSDSININFYVRELAENTNVSDYTVVYTFDGIETTVYGNDWNQVSNNKYYFQVAKCAARQMNDDVNFKVYYHDTLIKEIPSYSIRQYCVNAIEANTDAKLVDICRATLSYGAEAQKFFKYKDADTELATYGGYGLSNPVATVPNYAASAVKGGSVTKVTASLSTVSETAINFYLTTDRYDYSYGVEVGGAAVSNKYLSATKLADGRVLITVKGIVAKNLDKEYTLTFNDGSGVTTVTYSALAYCSGMQNTASAGAISKAIYNYYLKASAYL